MVDKEKDGMMGAKIVVLVVGAIIALAAGMLDGVIFEKLVWQIIGAIGVGTGLFGLVKHYAKGK